MSLEQQSNGHPPVPPPRPSGGTEPTSRDFPRLLKATAKDASHLVEQEAKLLKREIELKIDRTEKTLAAGAVGAIGTLVTLFAATATAILGLAVVLPAWAAALVVTVAWAIASVVGFGWAKKRFEQQTLTPRVTRESVRRDVRALEEAT